jgi:glutamine amidotransferase
MGWNTLKPLRDSTLCEGIEAGDRAYFVHSYAAPVTADCVLSSEHGQAFAAVVQRGRVSGAQFHPERSAKVGARLLLNFLERGLA